MVRLPLSRMQSLTHLFMYKALTDVKLKLFYGNMNYKNMIYHILLVFIILTYFMKNFSPQLKL